MAFVSSKLIRFAHVDAAGIVFYPRYFELINELVEDYFAGIVGVSFGVMHDARRLGVPTVALTAEFIAPSRLGDVLEFVTLVERVGTSSAEISVIGNCAGQQRIKVRVVLVCMDLDGGRPVPWPADMRPVDMLERPQLA